MPKIALPIAGGFYQSSSLPISAQQCINWYPNIVQAPALSQETLFGCPGLSQLVTTGEISQQNRGVHVKNGIFYFVNADKLYRLNDDGGGTFSYTSLGIVTGSGKVSMADNGTQLMILDPGGDGFIYNEDAGTPFQQILSAGFTANGDPQIVVFIDGYFVCTTDSKKFISSAPNDGLSWDALDAGTAEADPDIIRSAFVFQNQLFILGSETVEVFENVGGTGFPFQRIGGFIIPKGISSPFGITATTNSFVFIGAGTNESAAIWGFTGNGVEKISTTAIDSVLSKLSDSELAQVTAVSYADSGAYFSGFALPNTNFFYDSISGRWHERRSFSGGQTQRWRGGFMAQAYGRVIVGDILDGRIGELDMSVYSEYGNTIFRRIRLQPLFNLGNAIFASSMELTMESGVGDLEVIEPKIRMRHSDDAKKWSNELKRNIGRMGEYAKRAIWRRLGRIPRFRIFEFTMTDPVKPVIIKLELKLKGSSNG
jgi:hypothetical protein